MESVDSECLAVNFGCDGQGKTQSMLELTGGEVTAINSMRSTSDGQDGAGKSYHTDGKTVARIFNRLSVDLFYKEPNITENVQYNGTDKVWFALKNFFAKMLTFFGNTWTKIRQA